ncbi:hypothetical protein CY652_00545 [Burkholderia sp. WAC0059]|uniref:hypothetical protein n=1 Tax=Burkholderia sp. WAC0059 TaxID=2066022 RepID=UPI000C7EC946|nr:hypothetical protein [Burkholderia sp. WAC0059]PLZ04205.1 hypothetical protein CY652_00545 [Burkholderia sp. WAC0059]
MRRSTLFVCAAAVAVVCASGAAEAARVGVFIGGPYYPVAPVPYYYGPPPVVAVPVPVPTQPPTYVEQGQVDGQQADPDQGDDSSSWYYCDASKTYYPYVKQCASGWRPVPAQPAPAN